MHTQALGGHHDIPLFPRPQVSPSDAPFLGAPRKWPVSSSPRWGRTSWLGTGPRALPDPVAIPGGLVRPFNESNQGSAIQRVRTPVQNRTWDTIRWRASSFISRLLRSNPRGSRGRRGWNLTGASKNVAETSARESKQHARRVGELRFTTPAAQRSYHSKLWASNKGITEFLYTYRHD